MSKVVSNESSPSFCTMTSTFNFSVDPSRKDSLFLNQQNKQQKVENNNWKPIRGVFLRCRDQSEIRYAYIVSAAVLLDAYRVPGDGEKLVVEIYDRRQSSGEFSLLDDSVPQFGFQRCQFVSDIVLKTRENQKKTLSDSLVR